MVCANGRYRNHWAAVSARRAPASQLVVGLLAALIAVVAAASAPPRAAAQELLRHETSERHMGVEIKIVLYAADLHTANLAAKSAYARFAELDETLSDYKAYSELSKLNAKAGTNQAVRVSDDLWFLLDRSLRLAAESDGAFDATVGPLVKAWRSARLSKTFPSAERLSRAKAAVGYRQVRMNSEARTVELPVPFMQLDFGGIAMGYAADEALKAIQSQGVTRAMIDASGDIRCGDAPPGRAAWTVGIAPLTESKGPPSRIVEVVNGALTTSGDAFQFVVLDGKRYSHIVDPRTGLGLTARSSVTITAPTCIDADSLATAVSVLGPDEGLKLLKKHPGAEAYIVREVDGKITTTQSPGFRSIPVPVKD